MGEGSSSLAARLRYLLLFTTVFGVSFLILTSNKSTEDSSFIYQVPSESWKTRRYSIMNSDLSYTIKTEGCRIPYMKAINAGIEKYVAYPSSLQPCLNSSFSLLNSDREKIWIIEKNVRSYKIKRNILSCCYQAFYRPTTIEDITSTRVDNRVKYDDCILFKDKIDVSDEFVKVTCSVNSKKIYEQFFIFALEKEFIKHDIKGELTKNEHAYNVLILGIDAVSRLNFHRTMPKTVNYLKSKKAIEMMGYNKVGDNTFPNLIPMLLGIKESELKKVCFPHPKATFDNCPFIWEWFKQAGYYTALGEDSSALGTFNYVKVGFSNTPTDYYLHTFIHEAEKIGTNKDFNSYLCLQHKHFYKVLLDYVENLTITLKNKKLFGFFWEISMSHDYLNYPMVMDDTYVQFFKKLEESNYLNDTIILVVSDHGIRWGGIRSTKQGRIEERLPFLFVLTPPSFKENFTRAYSNLKLNSQRLVTPFDVYATLSDLVDLKNIDDEVLLNRIKTHYSSERGISLFLPIPTNRTCEMASIDDHWCTCHREVVMPKKSPEGIEAAERLVLDFNEMLEEYPQCARLTLAELLDVTKVESGTPGKDEVGWEEFMVVVRTMPGNGIFEATLRKENNIWKLIGTASRLNLYGSQSSCVHNYQLKLYCYCN